MSRIMISCGEPSGDLYAAALTTEILRRDPNAEVMGLGGARLAQAGGRLVGDYRGLAVTGLVEALAVVPRSLGMLRRLVAAARRSRPDVFVAIDFPDFNFRLAAALKRLGIPIVYYIPPQLWAWRRGRMKTLARLADKLLLIFPFEPEIYRQAGVAHEFVGHPLLDLAVAGSSRRELLSRLRLDPDAPTIALLPGSRPNELQAVLPVLVEASRLIAARVPRAQFLVARAPGLDDRFFAPLAGMDRLAPALVPSAADDVLAASDVALMCSGTATVQGAIHGCPMVVVYRVSPLSYRLGKRFLLVDTYGMVNLVAGRRIVPELIQESFTPSRVAEEALAFLTDADRRARTIEALAEVRHKLGEGGASRRAAEAILRLVEPRNAAKLV